MYIITINKIISNIIDYYNYILYMDTFYEDFKLKYNYFKMNLKPSPKY